MSRVSTESAVRIGPITILTLLIILCLATLSVLSLTTARASAVAADKQDASVQATYDIERQGQEFTSEVDSVLYAQRQSGGSSTAALAALQARYGSSATFASNTITRKFSSSTRTLTVQLEIRSNLTYQVMEWTTSSTADTSQKLNLWSGSTN